MSKTRRRRSKSNGARIRREMKNKRNKRNKDDHAKGEQDENGRIRRRLKT
jgi:hypothetical protein